MINCTGKVKSSKLGHWEIFRNLRNPTEVTSEPTEPINFGFRDLFLAPGCIRGASVPGFPRIPVVKYLR